MHKRSMRGGRGQADMCTAAGRKQHAPDLIQTKITNQDKRKGLYHVDGKRSCTRHYYYLAESLTTRGRILKSIYGTVNIKFYPKSNLRAITQIRSILNEVSKIATVNFTIKFVITLRQDWSNLSSIYGNCLL